MAGEPPPWAWCRNKDCKKALASSDVLRGRCPHCGRSLRDGISASRDAVLELDTVQCPKCTRYLTILEIAGNCPTCSAPLERVLVDLKTAKALARSNAP